MVRSKWKGIAENGQVLSVIAQIPGAGRVSTNYAGEAVWEHARTRNSQSFGSRSNIDDSETFKALQISKRRPALTRFLPLSYF